MDPLYALVNDRLRFAGICTILVGGVLLIVSVLVWQNHRQFIAAAVRTRGEISNYTERVDNGDTYYKAVIKFKDADGEGHVFESDSSSTHKIGQIGDAVDVLYFPKVPADAMIDSFSSLWLMPLILAGLGGFFALIGTLLMVWPRIQLIALRRFRTMSAAAR